MQCKARSFQYAMFSVQCAVFIPVLGLHCSVFSMCSVCGIPNAEVKFAGLFAVCSVSSVLVCIMKHYAVNNAHCSV